LFYSHSTLTCHMANITIR